MPRNAALWLLLASLDGCAGTCPQRLSLPDMKNPTTVQGVVSKLEWTNPHAYIYLTVKNDRGQEEEWAVKLDSPSVLLRRGWNRETL